MSEKVGSVGGNMGGAFDDGVFDGVKKIIVGKDHDCVTYIKIEYEKDGKFETREHGTIRGGLHEFTVDYPNEYIVAVGGSYEHVCNYKTVLIRSLIFKTTYGRTSPILGHTNFFGKPVGTEFMLEGKNGGKLLGFYGRSGQAIDAIGAYFFSVSPPLKHFERQGGNGGGAWDDGAYDGVKKILVGKRGKYVSYVRFEYAKGEKMIPHAHGKKEEAPQEFVVDYPNEHITFVEGTIDIYLTSLKFKTSKDRTSPVYGTVVGRKFSFQDNDFKLVGFCGRSGDVIDAIGAHFAPLPAPTPTPVPTPTPTPVPETHLKMGPVGGSKGNTFDDNVFDGVTKVTIAADEYSITYIKIEYIKDGKAEIREHGTNRGEVKEFVVDYPKDNIIAVGGSYDHIFNYDTTLVTSIYFTTSKGFTSPKFGETKGTEFKFEDKNGGKLVGFHGRGGYAIDAIGAYFQTSSKPDGSETKPIHDGSKSDSPGKVETVGGSKGNTFDDGFFDGVKKLTIASDEYSVTYIKIEYEKGGKVETLEHGTNRGEVKEFLVDYPSDNIIAVGGSYDHIYNYDTTLITSLYFTTSKGFTSPKFGETKGNEFKFENKNGGKLVGFHGRGGYAIDAIGVHFKTSSKPDGSDEGSKSDSSRQKEPVGGTKGETFDDGVFDGVKKLTIASDEYSVTYIKIEYIKDGKSETHEHGTNRGEAKEFLVNYPNDNIIAVGGTFDHIFNYDTTLITSLYFTTSKGFTSPKFGETKGTEFKFEGENGGTLVGLHGRGGFAIDAIGAHFGTSSGGAQDKGDGKEGSSDGLEKLEAQGGKGGNEWDDGGDYEGVVNIYVGNGGYGLENIKFDYVKNGQIKEGALHGVKARGQISTFAINHPEEYVISVEGWVDSSNIIQGIQFKTNKKTSEYYGYEFSGDGTKFSLQVKDKKIVGFHGFSDSHINSLGAYFSPIVST